MKPYYSRDGIVLYNCDCFDVLRDLPDGSIDAIITDPPYGYSLLEWDRAPDIASFTREARRVVRPDGFYAFFGQLPSMLEWCNPASVEKFHFCEHISWVKRNGNPMHRLQRMHESICIYAAGGRKQFYQTTGPYEDVKLPGVLVDVMTLEGIDRHIKDLRRKANGLPGNLKTRGKSGNKYGSDGAKFGADCVCDRSPEKANFTNVWSFLSPGQSNRSGQDKHPTAKPVGIMKRLCEMLAPEGASICDPFMGSGSTGVAALQTGRHFIGIEKSGEYCEIAAKRIDDELEQARQMEFAA